MEATACLLYAINRFFNAGDQRVAVRVELHVSSRKVAVDNLAVDEEEEEYDIDCNNKEDRNAEDRDTLAGTLAGVPGVAHPDPFASLVSTTAGPTTIVYNDITSPFDKPWDLSLKADQTRWIAANEADKDHKRFNVSIATAHAFIELVQDKSEFYCWSPLMCVPVDGNGHFDRTTNTLARLHIPVSGI